MPRHTGGKRTAGGLSKKEHLYQVFNKARCRVTDPSNKDYPRYGGRGLTFGWDNYLDFKKDMGASYEEHKKIHPNNTTLERIDNNKGYSKENCRWATFQEQAKNRRTSRYITYKGKTFIVSDWAKKLGCSRQALRYRLERGWDVDAILNTRFSPNNVFDPVSKKVVSNIGRKRNK